MKIEEHATVIRIYKDAEAAKFIAQLVRENLNFSVEEFSYGDNTGNSWLTIQIFGY